MQALAVLMLTAAVASIAACGKPEEAAAPAPVAETPAPAPREVPTPTEAPAAPATEAAPASVAPTAPPAPAAPAVQAPAPTNPEPAAAAPKPVPAPAPTPVADLLHGQQIYRQACAFCHDRGVAGAPKTGDAAAWTARLAQGTDTLYAVAVRGKGAMPAKGGNPALSEADVKAAVDFMLAQSR